MGRYVLVFLGFMAIAPFAQATQDDPCLYYLTETDGDTEGGWIVSFPTGSSDYFNVRHDVAEVTVAGIQVGVADFGATQTYPRVGVYPANTGLDPSGQTPDLSQPYTEATSPPILGGPIGDRRFADVPNAEVTGLVHAVVQLPPGDSGLLGVHGDSDTDGLGGENEAGLDTNDSTGFTADSYSTPSIAFSPTELAIDLATIPSGMRSSLSLSLGDGSDMTGDFQTVTTRVGEPLGLSLHMPTWSGGRTHWMLFLKTGASGGVPKSSSGGAGSVLVPITGVLPAYPCDDGIRNYCRGSGVWPAGVGNMTLNYVALTGQAGTPGSIQLSNEISIRSLPDPSTEWGIVDDGSIESGWVVSIPSGSSDYFTNNFGPCPGQSYSSFCAAILGFGKSLIFPSSGLAPSNTVVDPSGNTPDLANAYENAPFPFPPPEYCSTAQVFGLRPMTPGTVGSGNSHGFIQLPPGDTGLIGVGADTTTSPRFFAGWTSDGFATKANSFVNGNWGIRVLP